jgi:hypothetical protein
MRVRRTGLFFLTIMCAMLASAAPVLAQTPAGARSVREINAFETSSSPFTFTSQNKIVWRTRVNGCYWHCWPCLSSSGSLLIGDRNGIRFFSPDSGRTQFYTRVINGPVMHIEPTDTGMIYSSAFYNSAMDETQVDRYCSAVISLTDKGEILSWNVSKGGTYTFMTYCGGEVVAVGINREGLHLLDATSSTLDPPLKLSDNSLAGRIASDGAGLIYCRAGRWLFAVLLDGTIDWMVSEMDLDTASPHWQYPYGGVIPNSRNISSDYFTIFGDGPYYSPAGQLVFTSEDNGVFGVNLQGKLIWGCEIMAEDAANFVLNRRGTLLIGPDYTIWNIAPDGIISKWFCSTEFADLATAQHNEDRWIFRGLYLLEDATGALLVTLGDKLFLIGAESQVVWRVTLPDNVAQRPLLLPNGNVVIVCDNGKVWCIGAPEAADTGGIL